MDKLNLNGITKEGLEKLKLPVTKKEIEDYTTTLCFKGHSLEETLELVKQYAPIVADSSKLQTWVCDTYNTAKRDKLNISNMKSTEGLIIPEIPDIPEKHR